MGAYGENKTVCITAPASLLWVALATAARAIYFILSVEPASRIEVLPHSLP